LKPKPTDLFRQRLAGYLFKLPRECRRQTKKKASFCNEALKGSLNLEVSKGPEETTGAKQVVSRKLNYLRVFPWVLGAGKNFMHRKDLN
jgi:hypothetical protein